MNDLPVGRSVEETIRLVKAFQFTVSFHFVVVFVLSVLRRGTIVISMRAASTSTPG